MIKFLTSGIAIAGLLGALHVLGTPVNVLASASHLKGDRLDTPAIEESCGDWPYYHHACLRDLANTSHARRRALSVEVYQSRNDWQNARAVIESVYRPLLRENFTGMKDAAMSAAATPAQCWHSWKP